MAIISVRRDDSLDDDDGSERDVVVLGLVGVRVG